MINLIFRNLYVCNDSKLTLRVNRHGPVANRYITHNFLIYIDNTLGNNIIGIITVVVQV